MKRHNPILLTAQTLSVIFNPLYLPLVGLIVLFLFSYLGLLPWVYKLTVLVIVYLFTVLFPTLLIRLYRHYQGWTLFQLLRKERRMVPYVISIGCYLLCTYIMETLHIPHFMGSILIAALGIQIVCAFVNVRWKISTHTAAIGGMAGALFGFGEIFGFNPVGWLCVVFIAGGLVGTSRLALRIHTLSEVVAGFLVGAFVAAVCILLF